MAAGLPCPYVVVVPRIQLAAPLTHIAQHVLEGAGVLGHARVLAHGSVRALALLLQPSASKGRKMRSSSESLNPERRLWRGSKLCPTTGGRCRQARGVE